MSFTTPIRWFKDPEDRKFLYQNIARTAGGKGNNRNVLNAELAQFQPLIHAYLLVLKLHAVQHVNYKFDEKDADKAFKDILPGAKCLKIQKRFVQTNENAGAPIIEFEVYY